MAKEPKKLDELFHDTLKDIYFAEKKILATLPKMAKAADSEELKAAFEKHHGETEGQIERLEQVFAAIDKKPQGKTCAAIVGITDEGAEIMQDYKGSSALDAGLLAAAQAVEHYEISRYGTLIAWAEELGLDDVVSLLRELSTRKRLRTKLLRKSQKRRSISRPRLPDLSEWQMPRYAGHLLLIASATRQSRHCIRKRRNDELFETPDLGG